MQQTHQIFSRTMTPSTVASAFLHALLLSLLVFGLPQWKMEPEGPEAIQVQLVDSEEAAPEEDGQAPEPADEETSEEQETAAADQPDVLPIPILRPVYQFGEEDAGPVESDVGEDLSGSEADEASPAEEVVEGPDPSQTADVLEAPNGEATVLPETVEEQQETTEKTETALSLHDTENPDATTAMEGRTRGVRAGELCVSELRRQLLGSPHPPNLLPTYRLDEGTVLQVHKGAFRSNDGWYNLKFRCEFDEAVTRIVSFEFEVGTQIPREEWAARGFPES